MSVAERRTPCRGPAALLQGVASLRDATKKGESRLNIAGHPNGLLMKWLRIAYNGCMKIKNAFVVSVASFVALCASFGTAHGAENPANGLLMKTFEFGDSGVCAANFIERELDWSGAVLLGWSRWRDQTETIAYRNPDGTLVVVAGNWSERARKMSVRLGSQWLNFEMEPNSFETCVVSK